MTPSDEHEFHHAPKHPEKGLTTPSYHLSDVHMSSKSEAEREVKEPEIYEKDGIVENYATNVSVTVSDVEIVLRFGTIEREMGGVGKPEPVGKPRVGYHTKIRMSHRTVASLHKTIEKMLKKTETKGEGVEYGS